MREDATATGDDPELQPLHCDHDDNNEHSMVGETIAVSMSRICCPPEEWCIVKGMRNSLKIWNMLETSLCTSKSYIGRGDILNCSMLANLRKLNHFGHTSPNSVTSPFRQTIPKMLSQIKISAGKYFHLNQHSMPWYYSC
jgi:hypothetical protein